MSTSTLIGVVVIYPNDIIHFRPPSLSFPLPFNQRPPYSSSIFSLSNQGKSPTPTATKASKRKPVSTYLMERLGFSEEDSLSISKKLLRQRDISSNACDPQVTDLISFEKADYVITFLQEYCGLDLSQVSKLINKHPRVLTADLDKTIKPKIKLVQQVGFSTSDLAHVLSTSPCFFLEHDLTPAIQALRGIVGSDQLVVKVLKKLQFGSASYFASNLIPNVTMLENEYGIPRDKLIKFMTTSPQSLMRNTESLRDVLVRMEGKWGITRDSTEFFRAIHVFCSNTDDNIESKCQVFRSCGWSDSDILSLIGRNPYCLGLSEAMIKKKLDFHMKELGYKPAYMASRTVLFSCNLENRVVPRHRVLKILKEKLLIKADYKLDNAVRLTDNQFFDRFIRPFKNEVPELCEIYINGGTPTEKLKHLETSGNEPSTLVALE